jgi:hypothetical protein
MSGAIPPLPQYAIMAWCSDEAQGQLYPLPFNSILTIMIAIIIIIIIIVVVVVSYHRLPLPWSFSS